MIWRERDTIVDFSFISFINGVNDSENLFFMLLCKIVLSSWCFPFAARH